MSWYLAAGGAEAFALLQENQELWKSFMPSPYDFEGCQFPAERFLAKSDGIKYANQVATMKGQIKRALPSHYELLKRMRG
ncbi:hypothetical protein [endosymbiont of Ridgeia piscesae]|jgi:hypothetical protein|uniref:Uncharacterized protein n=1 Tax=endosymbiont of Ridgeia piscesae TaxID=54398 RepID=A0A0T5Z4Y8_9GAMM|nr:hypothetical protein [endosymbiont of Ridgeia piscesae]KRT55731.1 hypothetical protein Ga0074115_12338 [endosymbiont of Ridgeia piscesae]KRT57803.1 hypothetical protein Ga0076813_12219 [endosymbiont of Ridgeia piscesae]